MSSTDPEYFYVGTGYHDPLDPREDSPTEEEEDRIAAARELRGSRREDHVIRSRHKEDPEWWASIRASWED